MFRFRYGTLGGTGQPDAAESKGVQIDLSNRKIVEQVSALLLDPLLVAVIALVIL